jgi:hypothetical protein
MPECRAFRIVLKRSPWILFFSFHSTHRSIMKFSIVLSAINLVVSGTTLVLILVGARKALTEVVNMKTRTNESLNKFKSALNEIEI